MKALTLFLKKRTESQTRDFLPALLEIVERPPSPASIAMASTICLGAIAALSWAIIGQVDLVAVARGKVQPSGRVRLVQAVEFGKVKAIHLRDGSTVTEGDLILELETDDVRAEVEATRLALFSARAESARRSAAVSLTRETMELVTPQMPEDIPAAIASREILLFLAERDSLRTQMDHIDSQISQKRIDQDRLSGLIAAQQALLNIQKERVAMRNALLPSGAGTRASMMDAEESLRYQETILAGYEGDLRSTEQMGQVLTAERARTFSAFISDQRTKMTDALRLIDDSIQKLARAEARYAHFFLRSPVSGVVSGLSVHAPGQVVTAGQEIVRVVPSAGSLEVEVYLPNKDVGFVSEGQEASIKLDAFPFTEYGVLGARVLRISQDAIPEPEARQIEQDGFRGDARTTAGAQRMQNLVYSVILDVAGGAGEKRDSRLRLAPGMAVTAEIKTGRRRVIEYLLSPLKANVSDALRER